MPRFVSAPALLAAVCATPVFAAPIVSYTFDTTTAPTLSPTLSAANVTVSDFQFGSDVVTTNANGNNDSSPPTGPSPVARAAPSPPSPNPPGPLGLNGETLLRR